MSKGLYLFSAILGVLLNLMLMLLPSILLGVPELVLLDRRLAVFLVIITLWVILTSTSARQRDVFGVQAQAKWLPTLMRIIMLAVFLISLTDQAIHKIAPLTIFAIIGGFLMIAGVLLRQIAIRDLSPYFLDDLLIISGQALVTTGIYQRVRHPSELGNLCIALGSTILLGSTIGFGLCILGLLPIVLIRIHYEDRLLMKHYPQKFKHYKHHVPSLFNLRLVIFWASVD